MKTFKTILCMAAIGCFQQSLVNAQHIVGSATNSPSILLGRANGYPSIRSSGDGSGHLIFDSSSGTYLSLNHYTSDNVAIAAGGGKVGLGTTTPAALFDLNPGGSESGPKRARIQANSSIAALYVRNDGSGNEIETENGFIVNSSGYVGIGTTVPDAKLTVKGDIHTQEVTVDLQGAVAPDFVFEEDYDLKSLEETEEYIQANKHLPEIPSASEMEENGFELKEMNLKLLQKVEELTLYLIEQNKEIKSLKEKVEKLESDK